MPNPGTYAKMIAAGALLCIGGPALVYYVSPSEDELFKVLGTALPSLARLLTSGIQRYNPELQKRSLQDREKRQEEFDNFVTKLKEYSKSNKPIWDVAAEEERKGRAKQALEQQRIAEELQKRRDELKREQKSSP
ncbi:MAG: assembly factor cbp4 [Trichoglossum hirsutum]|nr:MAG: assembly factor cbp4 [Trichoglossum hirsutum]